MKYPQTILVPTSSPEARQLMCPNDPQSRLLTGFESPETSAVLRAIDANANRVTEALRVVEDVARFVMEDPLLVDKAKRLRHEIAAIMLAAVAPSERLAARDVPHDVGADVKADDEMVRADIQGLTSANLQRAQQSLRSLEEHFKLFCQQTAIAVERLRYQTYALEQAIAASLLGRGTMRQVIIYALVDGGRSAGDFEQQVRSLIQAGVDAIQLRDKNLADRELLARGRALVELARGANVLTFINDRPDLARLARTIGVHLGQDDLPVHEARQILEPGQLIGVSTHSWEQAQDAVLAGANYLGIGPVFPSRTKTFDKFVDEASLHKIFSELSLPVLAIGGIEPENVDRLASLGATRVAVSGALSAGAGHRADIVRRFRQALAAGQRPPLGEQRRDLALGG